MKFSFKLSLVFLAITSLAFSQRGKDGIGNIIGTSIVNEYTTLSNNASANTSSIIVANASALDVGDLIMIVQMQGASVNVINGGTVGPWFDAQAAEPTDTSFGRVTALNGAGNNELAEIKSISGTTITLNCALKNSYSVIGKTQIVRVARYTSLNVDGSGIITCPHWDKTLGYGGIIAIEVEGNTTIAAGGKIDATGLGFRGGAFWYKSASSPGSTRWGALYRDQGTNKGESIAGDTTDYTVWAAKFCKGSIANGGGGGNSVNGGGGGGSNAGLTNKYFGGIGNIDTTTNSNYITAWNLENTATVAPLPPPLPLWRANTNSGGGRGGYTFSSSTSNPLTVGPNSGTWSGDNRRVQGGLGGRPLPYNNNQLYLGGGGGAGDGEQFYNGAGGDGGGIIYLMSYGTISGAGQIISDGEAGETSYTGGARNESSSNVLGRDGAGGGGGGGAIVVNSVGTISGISISANGGNGGNQEMKNQGFTITAMAYGPGGGGGGGYINVPTGTSITTSVNGGVNGTVIYLSPGIGESCKIDNTNGTGFPPNGATKGGPGTSLATINPFYIATTGATICAGNSASVSANINGTAPNPISVEWFTDSIGGNPFNTGTSYTTPVLTTTTSYWVGTCPGTYREKVTVVVNSAPAAPVATSPINYCQNTIANELSATATGTNTIVWYDASSGGNILTAPLTPSTVNVGPTSYFAAQSNGSCSGARTEVVVNVIASPSEPNVTSPVDYCQNQTPTAISATLSGSGNTLLYWGTDATGGTSTGLAPTPSTSIVGSTTYYVSESNGTCESARVPIIVNVNATPPIPNTADTISYCQNQVASQLTPTGTNFYWYTVTTGGAGTNTAPTPLTNNVGITTYYVSELQGTCESLRDSIKIVVNTSFSAPTALNDTNCINSTANVLLPNGTGYNWYTSEFGGTPSASITPSTVTTGTVSYYVSQGSGTCESARTRVDVITLELPTAPALTGTLDICEGNLTTLTISNPTETYNWYTSATGGTSFLSANTFTTPILNDTTSYYVETFDGHCSSVRNWVRVNVNPIPSSPTTTDTISYCLNESAIALTPNGTNYNWYTTASGGTANASITPSTSANGITTYYVSETQNGCESLRDSVKVVVNNLFSAPSAPDVEYCLNETATPLTPNGTGYHWYILATGGSANTSITPSTNIATTLNYYVSQGSGSCESPRTQVNITIHSLPNKPIGTDVTYCINESATPLIATASGTLNWYASATGGTAISTAPTPVTSTVGNTDYFVTQTDANTCESERDTITVSVLNMQSAPTTSNISYCENATASPLSATGTSQLNWWGTAATGGTSITTAPTPITTAAGTTTYYVSQGTGACESPRASIVVTINSKPTISFTQNVNTICENNCVTFTANSSATCTNLVWDFGDGNTGSNTNQTNCFANAGGYNVKVVCTNINGCSDSSVVNNAVIVSPTPQAQFSISPSTMVTPNTTINFVADTGAMQPVLTWNFGDASSGTANTSTIFNPSHLYVNVGIYCVTLTAGTGLCTDSIEKCIDVTTEPFIQIPNVFTPNGDGINDLFSVTSSGVTKLDATIYDRWGIKMYTWEGTSGAWDGKNKSGNKSSNGVYYYIINTTDFKNETKQHTGYLQLIDSN